MSRRLVLLTSRRWVLVAFVLSIAGNAGAADPFYEQLLREGTDAYHRGDFVSAVKCLRVANFGFLEEPPLLARGLILLALSEARSDDREGFRETFLRLSMIEERFQAYSQANISAGIRSDFEQVAARLIPRSTLASDPSFSYLADRQLLLRLESLSGNAKRRELEQLIEQHPDESGWQLMLARFELDEGHPDDAIRIATSVLDSRPNHPQALLIRGLAFAEDEKWNEAMEDLVASGEAGRQPLQAEALLHAYVELERWREASTFLASLSEEIRSHPSVQVLARRVEQLRD